MAGVRRTILAAALALFAAATPAAAGTNPLANPPSNITPPPYLLNTGPCTTVAGVTTCPSPCAPDGTFGYNASTGCLALGVSALDLGRSAEHLVAVHLPSNFSRLSVSEQLFVVVNLERIARRVPPLVGLAPALDASAQAAAVAGTDPPPKPSYGAIAVALTPSHYLALGGTWGEGLPNAAAMVFAWVYDDGWGGAGRTSNVACTSASAAGCWGHRDELLGKYSGTTCVDCLAGSGYVAKAADGATPSYAFLIVQPTKAVTALSFSWNADVLPYLPPGPERVRAEN